MMHGQVGVEPGEESGSPILDRAGKKSLIFANQKIFIEITSS